MTSPDGILGVDPTNDRTLVYIQFRHILMVKGDPDKTIEVIDIDNRRALVDFPEGMWNQKMYWITCQATYHAKLAAKWKQEQEARKSPSFMQKLFDKLGRQ